VPHSPVLRVRLGQADLDAIDARARAAGVRRSDIVRKLIRAGLAAEVSPAPGAAPLAVEPLPPASWQDAARRLQRLAPERWSSGDDVLDGLLGELPG
jgi:hypothetical protein